MNKRRIIIGVFVAVMFIMLALVPAADNMHVSNKAQIGDLTTGQNQSLIKTENYTYHFGRQEINMNLTFIYSGNYMQSQHIVKTGNYGIVSVYSNGNRIYLNLTVKRTKDFKEVSGDCIGTYYKFPKNHEAVLSVIKIPALSPGTSPADIVAVFGEAVIAGSSNLLGAISDFLAALADSALVPVIAVLAADYVALNIYADTQHDPTVYFDLGVSWDTQWWHFYDIGAYGEEGAFTGSPDSHSSGVYVPLAIGGGKFGKNPLFAMAPHKSVWNPFEEPPW
ncbi:MAG: hypothetical protein RE471_08650 [Ferroplasma sp.]|uniref:hypothetical protein n=1 Tax=Ferroplasma sp. TaxID=2591003 RepID=UPI002814E54B|nr:hypothetical protein [Ferroplasma sp.]WMT51034.1 MAG: hypothetical protein RE471_08650 [Ferroplasma sp.]